MSATGRATAPALPGLERDVGRHPEDFYRTPAWAVDAILPHLRVPDADPLAVRSDGAPRWMDPGCGDGAIAERVLARWPRSRGTGVEIDPGRAMAARRLPFIVHDGDFLTATQPIWHFQVDLVIGNPPYEIALPFVRRAIELTGRFNGEVAFLLRVGFLEAKRGSERDALLNEHAPDVYLLAKRPRFRGRGDGGDSTTYAWMVWGMGRGGRFVRLRSPETKSETPTGGAAGVSGAEVTR
jgi:hypothetical protein